MEHVYQKGSNRHVIVSLHGTGGHATSLFELSEMIDSEASLLGIQGDVLEQGMRRFFKRYADGSFDLEDLSQNTHQLHDTIQKLIDAYQLNDFTLTILGYSNGANITLSLFKHYETVFDYALLFHPSVVWPEKSFRSQRKLKALISYGAQDPFIREELFDDMLNQFKEAEIAVRSVKHAYGHQLVHEEIERARQLIREPRLKL